MMQAELDYAPALNAADALSALPGFAFLDSSGEHGALGRYSFIGVDPFGSFAVREGQPFWNGEALPEAPLAALRVLMRRFPAEAAGEFPFTGGAIGYIAYDFGRRLEKLREPEERDTGLDEMRFDFYDLVLAFDHAEQRCVLFSSGFPEREEGPRRARAGARLEAARRWLAAPPAHPAAWGGSAGEWRSNFTPAGYEAAVRRVQDYILAGDIYQANISQRFSRPLPADFDAWAFYRTLRAVNPAPFSAFLRSGEAAIASSSPERFLSCRGGVVEARPIKGTARRGDDAAQDARIANALLASEKDRAENTMIVDLLRNDLSRVCAPGTVQVPMLCGLETYSGLHHLTSAVTGALRQGFDAIGLLEAAFPGGSITGAPKLRAMDIITEIERAARGVYCGAIGYLGFDGALDLNIAIRTVTIRPGEARFSVGGGITLLSDPAAEYAETLTKARRIFEAFAVHDGAAP